MITGYETSLLILKLNKNQAQQIKNHITAHTKKYKGWNLHSFSFAESDTVIFVWSSK
jgi:hypothetical protein